MGFIFWVCFWGIFVFLSDDGGEVCRNHAVLCEDRRVVGFARAVDCGVVAGLGRRDVTRSELL